MKTGLSVLFFLLAASLSGQTANPNYDSTLVNKLGADAYGMKTYVFVILKTGENLSSDRNLIDSCFTGHLENINRLAGLRQLIVTGPFGNNENDFRGLFILNVATLEDAWSLLGTDPAIQAGLLKPELYLWYGSAALPEYLETADRIWKVKP
jgi:uncharacterized protein YciI